MQDDLTDGVRHLVAEGTADPKRVCIVGASYGGYAALAGATFTPEVYACAASVNGVSDLPNLITYVSKHWGSGEQSDEVAYWKDNIGSPLDPNVAAKSPEGAASRVKAPILLIHSVDDSVVPITQSEQMLKALQDAGKPVEFVRLEGDDHWLSHSSTRTQMLRKLEEFLGAHLAATTK
jgi:dipeptidyl aminopeptidase/acylaminoacyl peptidase